jgi:hypothetical protein
MPYKEVWVDDADLEDFDDEDLIHELENRGYEVSKTAFDIANHRSDLFKIRQAYLLDTSEQFRKFMDKFFEDRGMPI